MKIKMRTTAANAKGILLSGKVYEVDDAWAAAMLEAKCAVLAAGNARVEAAVAPHAQETATIERPAVAKATKKPAEFEQ